MFRAILEADSWRCRSAISEPRADRERAAVALCASLDEDDTSSRGDASDRQHDAEARAAAQGPSGRPQDFGGQSPARPFGWSEVMFAGESRERSPVADASTR